MKQNLHPAAIAVAVVLVLGIIGFFIYRSSAPPSIPPEAAAEHKDMSEWYRNQGKPGPVKK